MAFFILKIGNHIMTNGSYMMNNALCSNLVVVTCLALLAIAPDEKAPNPKSRARSHEQPRDMFTNVFVQRRAHNEFAKLREVAREVHGRHRRTGFGKPKFHQREGPLSDGSDGVARRGERLGAESG